MHALGKILHNKRDWEGWPPSPPGSDSGPAGLRRPPPESDPDEAVAAAGLDASSSAAFLFENLPLFVQGEEALGDAASSAAMVARTYAQVSDEALRDAFAAVSSRARGRGKR